MQISILSKDAQAVGKIALPAQFAETVRPDIIKRAVEVIWANTRQPYGTDPQAGKRAVAKLSRRRRDYRGSYGHGISRVPRKIMSHNGTQFNWVGAFAPSTVKGFRAHPPKAGRNWKLKINHQEKQKAIRSALAATIISAWVSGRNHKAPKEYPFALTSDIEDMAKTKDLYAFLVKIGLEQELDRAAQKSIRSGKGKNRGRPYKKRKGPLLVVSGTCALAKAGKSIPGVDIIPVHRLNTSLLAPGAVPGRLTLFTEKALNILAKEKLFM